MKKIFLLLGSLIFCSIPVKAQNKLLTMEEAVIKQRTTLAPEKILQFSWLHDGEGFSFRTNGENKNFYLLCKSPSSKPEKFLSLSEFNTALKSAQIDSLKELPAIHWISNQEFSFVSSGKKFNYNLNSRQIISAGALSYPEQAENMDESPSGKWTAYTIENNLFIGGGKDAIQVTKDTCRNIVNGHSVHRDEFGIFKGTFWSPKGNLLAFYRMDQIQVSDYPILELVKRPAAARLIKYPMAGDKSHEVTVGIFDPVKMKILFLKTGEPKEQYLTNIAWSADEKHIYIAVLNRDQNHLALNSYNSLTGDLEKNIFEEKDEKYVHPLHPMTFVKNHPELFIWQSQRNGFNNLYLYNIQGKLIRQLTGNDDIDGEVTELIGFDAKGEHVYYQSIPKNQQIDRIIRTSNLSTGKNKTLTLMGGTHQAKLSPEGTFLLDTYSSVSTPRIINILDQNGIVQQEILNAKDPLKEFKLGKMKIFTIKSSDATPLYCRIILPIDFDSTKKYPVIVYLYGGPNVQLITNSWLAGSDLWYQYMAEHGYIVFTLDNRGSSGRGKKFEQTTFRHLGTYEMEDQLKGTDFLKSLSYVDKNRMGVFGWSFGGFMTTSLMTRHPGVFKAAVAGGPVIDWSYYEIMYTERYMDTPQSNVEGYMESSLLNYADKLQGKLLIIHGTSDDVVVWQHSLMFLRKCVEAGTQPDYFVYPGHLHNVQGKDRIHLFNKITTYLRENL